MVQEGKTFEESVTTFNCDAMRRDVMGIDKFCGIANRSVTGTRKNCLRLTSPTYSWPDEKTVVKLD